MFTGYNVITDINSWKGYQQRGEELYAESKAQVKRTLDLFINADGSIDGSKLQDDWFPTVKADIFISHSHKDKDLAVALSAWIKVVFNLDCFVDSTLWGYSEDLLTRIKARYCMNTSKSGYDNAKVRYAGSHVDMMLATALNKMIDKSECMFFLNTSNFLIPSDEGQATASPWIYFETVIANSVRKRVPNRLHNTYFAEQNELRHSDLQIKYKVDLTNFKTVKDLDFQTWAMIRKLEHLKHPLDILYIKSGMIEKRD